MAPLRRKSHGSIRSPHVKRNSQSQVIMEGWLYKLEGPSEEKITSSILLPSYRISPCTSDDKVSRKFSFKAEHQNMKTYYFASENNEGMKRWMNAMSLASIMQNFVRSESYDVTFSSASNDDEDSGFTTYRSRRHASQKLNNSAPNAESLTQRSNSYGERVGEVYLSSDDKYPNAYPGPSPYAQQINPNDPPRRQPLYANAPPKPRRLTQSDNYGSYDGYPEPEIAAFESSPYSYELPQDRLYHQKPLAYATNDNPHYVAERNPTIRAELHYVEGYPSYPHSSATPDVSRSQPPRPRSADFLEREGDCTAMPDVTMYSEKRQPQRPKSSLEYYDRYVDSEDCNFDYYREAVRIQADNLYANKNLNRPKKPIHRPEHPNYPHANSSYVFNQQESPCYASTSKQIPSKYREQLNTSSHKEGYEYEIQPPLQQKPKEESMQRLMEWKQRMLQSPLSRRNHLQSNSSDTSSPMTSPIKYKNSPRRDIDTPTRQYQSNNYVYSASPLAAPSPPKHVRQRNESPASQGRHQVASPRFSNIDSPKFSPRLPDPSLNQNVNLSAENLYKENIMYCVDSENNEILFSYDDTSPTSRLPRNLQACHYPPQMHSFTTMPNIDSIGHDSQDNGHRTDDRDLPSRAGKYAVPLNQDPVIVVPPHRSTTYSSDDEASVDSDNRIQGLIGRSRSEATTRNAPLDLHFKEPKVRKLVQQSEGLMCKGKRLSVSAGDLLGKTHEELVLLLIQLRRNQAKIFRAKEKLERQMEFLQERPSGKYPTHQSQLDLHKQIQLLEKQYDVTQPLVTLVDNMVKLGSLYGSSNRRSFSLPLLDTSQEDVSSPKDLYSPDQMGESSILSMLLAEESTFQKRISEIYSLDKGLRNETNSISSLHQDKEMLEFTLSGMRNKILDHQDRPTELQKLKKQQKMIEKELGRVKRLLSTSAKKIEDAASKNDQMEKDILHLRHILKEALKTGSSEAQNSQHSRADIEAELSRVQNVLDGLANHRQEINNTVIKLKGEAPAGVTRGSECQASPSGNSAIEDAMLLSKIGPDKFHSVAVAEERDSVYLKKVKKDVEVRASPTGVAGSAPLPVRKKQHSMYLETDLDTMQTRDLAAVHEKDFDDIPVYANADEMNHPDDEIYENLGLMEYPNASRHSQSEGADGEQYPMQDINEADERMKRFYGIIPKEKPAEIKTVRIVKRQSERRNRDKKRVTYDDQSSVWIVEEPDLSSSDDLLEGDEGPSQIIAPTVTRPSSIHLHSTGSINRSSNSQSAHERLFGSGAAKAEKPVSTSSQNRAYATKRSKRRHYTVSGYQYILDPQFSLFFKERPRSRDDVDMERCLRTVNTPDIVRSTIKKSDVFDDKIIERELGLPQKIEIPERYVEVEPEQLSASEKLRRSQKAENICKMLSATTATYGDRPEERSKSPDALQKKMSEEKRKRAHLLNLNRAIAREVVEKSKAVAVLATLQHMMNKPLTPVDEDLSPMAPLPITQQRYNYLT